MSRNTPRVCVGVPVHNGGELLERSLQSLFDQTFASFQVVIFENASSDNSMEIAQEFCRRDKRFSIQASETLLSAQDNFQRALLFCADAAEYFCLRAHDDYSCENFLSELVESLDQHSDKAHAAPEVVRIHTNGEMRVLDPGENVTSPLKFLRNCSWRDHWSVPPSWYYGLFRGKAPAEALISASKRLGSPWASDRLALMEFILSGKTIYNQKAKFYCLITDVSEAIYPEKTIYKRWRSRMIYFSSLVRASSALKTKNIVEACKLRYICWRTAAKHTHYYGRRLIFGLTPRRS